MDVCTLLLSQSGVKDARQRIPDVDEALAVRSDQFAQAGFGIEDAFSFLR